VATAPLQSTIPKEHPILTYLIASVWFINGFLFKVLNIVPRHEEIVARILGDTYSGHYTISIGIAEIAMSIWILSGLVPRLNALLQIAVIATMNVLEIILAPDLLLWGRWNGLFAFLFILLIYCNVFRFKKPRTQLT
jgi:hypothetical protein